MLVNAGLTCPSGGGVGTGCVSPAVAFVNKLYFGDNLDVLRTYVGDETVDLIYLDPPFNSQAQYNVLFKSPQDDAQSAQAQAFRDTWMWGDEAEWAFKEVMRQGGGTARLIDALRSALAESDMMAYLVMMAVRLHELNHKLKQGGSLYLHCDPTASHYLKVLLDGIFGPQRFQNEIVWKRHSAHSSAKRYGPVHDVILFYSKGDRFTWTNPRIDYEEEYLDKYYKYDDGDGRLYWRNSLTAAGTRRGSSGQPWRGFDPTSQGAHWKFTVENLDALDAAEKIYWPPGGGWPQIKRYKDELQGLAVSDLWDDINKINPAGNERIGYPTQKPVALLDRIIEASSNKGDLILDPFCGCGTTIEAAEKAGREWIGIDVAVHAVKVIESRLAEFARRIGQKIVYDSEGMPRDFESAVRLAERDKYQFQWWANYLFNPHALREQKKGADRGIDGELFFPNGPGRPWGRMLTSVKGGQNIGPNDIRAFARVLERENAEMGLFICLYPPTREMIREASTTRFANIVHGDIPKLQIVSIEEWFKGKTPVLPPLEHLPSAAFSGRRRSMRPATRPDAEQPELPFTFIGGKAEKGIKRHFNPGMVRGAA